jgi:hypothetical protein
VDPPEESVVVAAPPPDPLEQAKRVAPIALSAWSRIPRLTAMWDMVTRSLSLLDYWVKEVKRHDRPIAIECPFEEGFEHTIGGA